MAPQPEAPAFKTLKCLSPLLIAATVALVSCGSQPPPSRAPSKAAPDPFASIQARPTPSGSTPRAAPRWEQLVTWDGSGAGAKSLSISKGAIQWKADWSCRSGTLQIQIKPAPKNGGPLAEGACPGSGTAFSVATGPVQLSVENEGEWQIVISQQVTTPVDEAPLPEMTAPGARLVAKGDFFAVERKGRGHSLLIRLSDGALAIRLEDFQTSANTDLYVWASEAARPASSKQALDAPHVVVSELKSTLGNQNYRLPPEVSAEKIRSIVIWCQPVQIAYVASALESATPGG